MPDLTGTGGLAGVPLSDLGPQGVNASKPRTFVPPTGENTGQPGRPRTAQGSAAGGGGGGAAGSVPAPPAIAQLTDPRRLLEGLGLGQGGELAQAAQGGGQAALSPIVAQQGALSFDPLQGVWTMPDGSTRPGGSGVHNA